jgi:hypothetical protein
MLIAYFSVGVFFMKKSLFIFAAITALFLFGCEDGNDTPSGNQTPASTTLKIKNESSKSIGNVLWNNINFREDSLFVGSWYGNRTSSANVLRSVNLQINGNNTYSLSFSSFGTSSSNANEFFSGSWKQKDNNTILLDNSDAVIFLSENKSTLKWGRYS